MPCGPAEEKYNRIDNDPRLKEGLDASSVGLFQAAVYEETSLVSLAQPDSDRRADGQINDV